MRCKGLATVICGPDQPSIEKIALVVFTTIKKMLNSSYDVCRTSDCWNMSCAIDCYQLTAGQSSRKMLGACHRRNDIAGPMDQKSRYLDRLQSLLEIHVF